jgi:hypothetical protein
MLFREIYAGKDMNQIKHVAVLCGQNVEFLITELGR